MRTARKWKWLSLVLTVLLGFAVAMPSAIADSSESLRYMVEDVLSITTSMQRNTGAIQQKVNALPADPASTTDVAEAKEALLDALGTEGFFGDTLGHSDCEIVVPEAPAGTARLATITLIGGLGVDKAVNVRRGPSVHHLDHYFVEVDYREAVTFIDTASEGEFIEVCFFHYDAPQAASIDVHAHWDDRPMVLHVDE